MTAITQKALQIFFLFFIAAIFSCTPDETAEPNNSNTNTTVTDDGNNENTEKYVSLDRLPEIKDIVMYEINLRAFSNSGDFAGVVEKLDYLKAMGVNVIWLMPIYPVGEINSLNSPYCVKNYKEVSEEYGTLNEFKTLVSEAHKRDMAVIMDWVANHTSWDNDWIGEKNWYTQDAEGNIVHPPGTNWLDVADLDFSNAEMRDAMIDAMKYWVTETNIDGYRCDFADGVPFDFWKQANDALEATATNGLIMLAEGNRADHFAAGFDMNYGWDYYGKIKAVYAGQPANELFTIHNNEYINIPEGKHKLRFTTNHDESAWDATPMELFGGREGATTASVITMFMGGVPLIFTGQETGRVEKVPFFTKSPINWAENPEMQQNYIGLLNFYKSSETAKTGMNTNHSNSNVVCFTKAIGNDQLLIIANTRNQSISFSLPQAVQNTTWTNVITDTDVTFTKSIDLSNYQYLVLQSKP